MIIKKLGQLNNYLYLGGIHIHSAFSDGTGNIDSISKAAKKAGLDWIIITDHNSLEIEEGFFNGVCVIKGEEISPEYENHYLALGINQAIAPSAPEKFTDEVREQGGFGFAAHPDEGVGVGVNVGVDSEITNLNSKVVGLNCRQNSYTPIKWLDKTIIPDGVEIWNWFSQWGDNYSDKNIFTKAYAYLFKNKLVKEPIDMTMRWWDCLNNNSAEIVPAIGGIDAHAMKIKDYIVPITIFSYEKMFKTITNVLTFNEPLAEDFETRKSQILTAVKEGNNLIINRNVDNSVPEMNFTGGLKKKMSELNCLKIKTRKKASIKIFHNGQEICSEITKKCHLLLDKVGKYRVEIKIGGRGFAYTNPILIY